MCKLPQKYITVFILLFSTIFLSANLSAIEKSADEAGSINSVKTKTLAGSGLSDPNMAGNLVQTTLGLLVVLLVIAAAAWGFKRFGNVHVGAQGRMKIIGGISLGTRERAVLLQVGDQQMVVGVSPGRVQMLHVLEKPVQVENKPTDTVSFSSKLQSAILNRKNNIDEGKLK